MPGGLREACVRAIDTFASFGLGVWQILPLNPPDFVGSPYASPSAFALDPELLHGLAGDISDPSRSDLDSWLAISEWAHSWALFRILKSINPRSWVDWGRWSNPSVKELDRLRLDNEKDYWREIGIQWKLDQAMELIETHARKNGVLMNKLGIHYNTTKMRPPMPFSRENADLMIEVFDHVLTQVESTL